MFGSMDGRLGQSLDFPSGEQSSSPVWDQEFALKLCHIRKIMYTTDRA